MPSRAIRLLVIVAVSILVLLILSRAAARLYTDILWYDEVGYLGTFWTRIWIGLGVRAAAALLGAGLLFLNLWLVARHIGPVRVRRRYANIEIAERIPRRHVTAIAATVAVLGGWWLASLQFGDASVLGAASWLRQVSWGVADPLFGRDVAFYVFTLPFIQDVMAFLALVIVWATALVAFGHVVGGGIRLAENRLVVARPARLHLAALAATLLVLFGVRYWLGTYLLIIDGTGVSGSIGYTDVNARLPVFRGMAALSVVAGASVIYGAWKNALLPPIVGISALLIGGLVGAGVYPMVVQRFQVEPNELSREAPYIRWHLDFTRQAFGLAALNRQVFPYRRDARPSSSWIEPLFERLPLWDTEPLQRAFNAIQSLREYYWFPDADFDRYGPPGQEQQVVIGVREFRPEGLEPASRTWQSLHLNPLYIRGRGAVVAAARPVSEDRGTHELWVRNIEPIETDPRAPEPLRLTQTSVFFGETMDGYVVVIPGRDGEFTGRAGFDYPRGVPLSSFLRTLAFAWRFGDETLLFAREITPDSRMVFRRPIRDRVQEIVPFLLWDSDPLPVVYEGRVVWLLDGYTVSDSYPLARPIVVNRNRTRYLRNSVKAAVDAVTGAMAFYRLDPDDPILATYTSIFPGLFEPLDAMPAALRRHLRYPEVALLAQSEILQEYHLDRVEAFYAGQDVWQRPQQAAAGGTVQTYRPIRGLMPVPVRGGVEYLGAVPYIARGRQNMTALLLVRNDEPRYGELTLLEFPPDQQVPGPGQVQAMIEVDPIIAPQLSLLRQRGSHIDMGKLRVLPLDSAVLYVQPFFLSADENPIPELWGIVVSDGRNIAIGGSLRAAMAGLDLGDARGPDAPATAGDPGAPTLGVWPRQALELLDRAEARLRDGDWTGYGRALDELRALLEDLYRTDGAPEG